MVSWICPKGDCPRVVPLWKQHSVISYHLCSNTMSILLGKRDLTTHELKHDLKLLNIYTKLKLFISLEG